MRTWKYRAKVIDSVILLEEPRTIGDFELVPHDDVLNIVMVQIHAEKSEAVSDIAKEKYDEFFNSLMLSTGIVIDYELIGADEITPDREKKEYLEHFSFTIPVTGKVKLEKETRDQMWQERADIVTLSIKHDQYSRKALAYFIIGMSLTEWDNESFLNFYKSIELINSRFTPAFNDSLKAKILDLTEVEINHLRKPKRLFKFTCSRLGLANVDKTIDEIVDIRNSQDVAHARSKTPFKAEYVEPCKKLARELIIAYLNSC